MCGVCGEKIVDDDLRTAWKGTFGWVKPKGADSMVGRRDTGELAHESCILRIRHGLETQKQESLL